ncbi:hypothetical protein MferCBS31731_005840 [Microsporum ferrugineum]
MRNLFLAVSFTWLLFLVRHLHAAPGEGNIVAHVYERIWLWEMYDFFWDFKGDNEQSKLFPGQRRLEYGEFQGLLENPDDPIKPNKDLRSPMTASLKDVADDLLAKKWSGNLKKIHKIDPSLSSWIPPNNEPWKTKYEELIDKTEKEYTKIRVEFTTTPEKFPPARAERIQKYAKAVAWLREEDEMNHISNLLKKKDNGGCGLGNDVVEEVRNSRVPWGNDFRLVKVQQTLSNVLPARLGQKIMGSRFKDRAELISFVRTGYFLHPVLPTLFSVFKHHNPPCVYSSAQQHIALPPKNLDV